MIGSGRDTTVLDPVGLVDRPSPWVPGAAGDAGRVGPRSRWNRALATALQPESLISLAVVGVCVVFTFVQLQPSKLFLDTTPAGGDMGAHVWLPAYVKAHFLPHLRFVAGWAPDWYAGFPALTFFFPLPTWAIVFVSYLMPYNIAFKLVSVAGLVALPVAAWAFGRLARLPFPGPPCLAVGAVGYLFCRDFTIYGGNIASTMAGEYDFSISLAFALLFLGVVARGLHTGRMRALAALLFTATFTSHVLPTYFAGAGALVLFALHWDWRRLRWLAPVIVTGGFLAAVWALPFEYRLPYATNMGYQNLTNYLASLFPTNDLWLFILAAVGLGLSLVRRRQFGAWLGIMLVACGLAFRYAPQGRLWNARALPFWFLCLYLLAGLALSEIGVLVAEAGRNWSPRRSFLPVPVVALVLGLLWVGFPLRILPLGHVDAAGNYTWLGISSKDQSFVPDWVNWNYSGYQSPGKARRTEYFALVAAMAKIGKNPALGCGRAMWEYEPQLDQMGTPDALMLLPYWTHGCIGSMEGLYYESSATTPYHFLNASELSSHPADPVRGLDYASSPNLSLGVAHLQMLGVKYFMALTPGVQAQAAADRSLKLVDSVGPFPVTYTSGSASTVKQRTWKIYEVAGSQMVVPLRNQPVVMGKVSSSAAWLAASQAWYLDPARWNVLEASTGPKAWARVPAGDTHPPAKALPAVHVSAIRHTTQSISFHVDRTGVPVLVRTSYFPNWQASGAGTVRRVTPNLMVVTPTSHDVTLHYGYTPVDWIGFVLTLSSLAGVVVLFRMKPVRFGERRRPDAGAGPGPRHRRGLSASDDAALLVATNVAEPWARLEAELAGAPPGIWDGTGEVDRWLGQPGGLDQARFRASGWDLDRDPPGGPSG